MVRSFPKRRLWFLGRHLLIVGLTALLGLISTTSFSQDLQQVFRGKLVTNAKLHALFFLDPECPISQKYTRSIQQIAEQFDAEDVEFYVIISVKGIKRKGIKAFKRYYQFPINCFPDPKLEIARALGATVTPEVFLFNATLETVYSGAIDDWYYDLGKARREPTAHFLIDAINSVLRNEPVAVARTEAVGCQISYRERAAR